jgi:hypothetical protein
VIFPFEVYLNNGIRIQVGKTCEMGDPLRQKQRQGNTRDEKRIAPPTIHHNLCRISASITALGIPITTVQPILVDRLKMASTPLSYWRNVRHSFV